MSVNQVQFHPEPAGAACAGHLPCASQVRAGCAPAQPRSNFTPPPSLLASPAAACRLQALGIAPRTKDAAENGSTFSYVVFSAPPSGSADYLGEIKAALALWDGTGAFVFTSSAGVYTVEDGSGGLGWLCKQQPCTAGCWGAALGCGLLPWQEVCPLHAHPA